MERLRIYHIEPKLLVICLFTCAALLHSHQLYAQHVQLGGRVTDSADGLSLPGCALRLFPKDQSRAPYISVSNDQGDYKFGSIKSGDYILEATYIGYATKRVELSLSTSQTYHIKLKTTSILMQDIVVTAKPQRGLTTSTLIDRTALTHIQPSSLSDIRSLLPGGRSRDPAMGSVNLLTLRQAGTAGRHHTTSTLGTAFMIDGVPINTAADMQAVGGMTDTYLRGKSAVAKGVDMRSISTDDIDHIEIIRGVPTAEYGNLTNGLVKIVKRKGQMPYEARLKTDQYGHLAYLGKGWAVTDQSTVNASIDYYNAMTDPRNSRENYQRIGGSVRYNQKYMLSGERTIAWGLDLSGGSRIDIFKADPDNDTKGIDQYSNSRSEISASQSFKYKGSPSSWLKEIEWTSNISYHRDLIKQTRLVSLDRGKPMPIGREEGEHDGFFLPYRYIGNVRVDGQPVTAYAKIVGRGVLNSGALAHSLSIGSELSWSKNFGAGEIFDPTKPVYPDMDIRPRAFRDVPAETTWSAFVEDRLSISIGRHTISLNAGLRTMMPIGLPPSYSMRNNVYIDPRLALSWQLPELQIFEHSMQMGWVLSYGESRMMPVLAQLYPEPKYYDMTQLNYFHPKEECRRLFLRTYIVRPDVMAIQPARNDKAEMRLDLSYRGHNLSIIGFNERMSNGFRTMDIYHPYAYRLYDNTSVDADKIAQELRPPDLSELTYTDELRLLPTPTTGNGSSMSKHGVEWQYSSPRWPIIATRLSLSGAYYYTRYQNSAALYLPPMREMIEGKYLSVVGLYDWVEDRSERAISTNLTLDTYVQPIDLIVSASVQTTWLEESVQNRPASNILSTKNGRSVYMPSAYIDADGVIRPYGNTEAQDYRLRWLLRPYDDGLFVPRRGGWSTNIDIKVTKRFGHHIGASLFVNRIFDINPPYRSRGLLIRPFSSAYFGLEFNFKV